MITDIFYPIFTLTITVITCFIQKKYKVVRGFSPMSLPKHCPGPPGGLIVPPQTPSCSQSMCPYFFCIIP